MVQYLDIAGVDETPDGLGEREPPGVGFFASTAVENGQIKGDNAERSYRKAQSMMPVVH